MHACVNVRCVSAASEAVTRVAVVEVARPVCEQDVQCGECE